MDRAPPSVKIMVKNIPEYVNDAQLRPIFEEAGTVRKLDMMYNAKGTHKGYCFVEYADEESKNAAVRNLSSRMVNGVSLNIIDMGSADEKRHSREYERELRTVPRVELPDECKSVVADALRRLPLSQAFEAMEQMKQLTLENQSDAKAILDRCPQLSHAMLYMMYYLGMMVNDPETKEQSDIRKKNESRKRKHEEREERTRELRQKMGDAMAPATAGQQAAKKPETEKRVQGSLPPSQVPAAAQGVPPPPPPAPVAEVAQQASPPQQQQQHHLQHPAQHPMQHSPESLSPQQQQQPQHHMQHPGYPPEYAHPQYQHHHHHHHHHHMHHAPQMPMGQPPVMYGGPQMHAPPALANPAQQQPIGDPDVVCILKEQRFF